jgi:LacI family transcriptional regulator
MPIVNQAYLAKRLKMSRATISKALSDEDDISNETKKKVRRMAEELNYVPHYHAKHLQSKRTNTMGVVVPDISYSFFPFVIHGIMDVAHRSGYQIVLTVSRESANTEKNNILTLLSMRVDGMLVAVSKETQDIQIFEKVRRSDVPLLFFDRAIDELGFGSIGIDDRAAAQELIDFVVQCGYRNIGHLAGSSFTDIGRGRRGGYVDSLNSHGIPVREEWIVEGGFTRADGYRGFQELRGRGALPEVIYAANDQIALGTYDAAKQIGMRIPEDIGVVAFGHHEFAKIISPSLTIINVDPYDLGKKAMELMIKNIDEKAMPYAKVLIPAEVEIGESLRIPIGMRKREAAQVIRLAAKV